MAAALVAFTAVGTIDGVVALSRSIEDLDGTVDAMRIVVVCAAACAAAGALIGTACEVVFAIAERAHGLQRLVTILGAGPSAWRRPDPRAAARAIGWFVVSSALVAVEFTLASGVIAWLHTPAYIAIAIALGTLLPVSLFRTTTGIVSNVIEARLSPKASPATAVMVCGGVGLAAVALLLHAFGARIRPLDAWFVGLIVAIVLTFSVVIVAGLRHRESRSPVRPFVPVLAIVSGIVAAASVGAWPHIASIVATRSSLASLCVPWLRATVIDRHTVSAHAVLRSGARPRMSFVVLSFDALRADHVGAYGYARATTPNVDAFAQTAARFANAYAIVPSTVCSFATVWTGRYTSELAWSATERPALLQPVTTVGGVLRDEGYDTAMFTDTFFLNDTGAILDGFTTTEAGDAFRGDTDVTVTHAAAWIRHRSHPQPQPYDTRPFLVWVHLIGPHTPYRDLPNPWHTPPAEVDRYDAEIAAADAAARKVLEAVADASRNQPLTVIVMSDHGEAFGEHGHLGHGSSLHEEEVRVPLLIRTPGSPPGRRNALASLMDLAPTILDLAEVPTHLATSGQSLVPAIDDLTVPTSGAGWREAIHLELPSTSWVTWNHVAEIAPPWAVLWDEAHGNWELYNLAHDPGESQNLMERRPGIADALQERLVHWRAPSPVASPGCSR